MDSRQTQPPAKLDYPYLTGADLASVLEEECTFVLSDPRTGAFWYLDPNTLGREDVDFEGWRVLPQGKAAALARLARLTVSHPPGPLRVALVGSWRELSRSAITSDKHLRDLAWLIAKGDPPSYTSHGCTEEFSECLIQNTEIPPW